MEKATENLLFLIPVTTGIIFFFAGVVMLLFPPKNINVLYGYRTKSSMKNKEQWDFAQKYSAKELMKSGIAAILIGLTGLVFHLTENTATIVGIGIVIVIVALLFIRVESAIKSKFKQD